MKKLVVPILAFLLLASLAGNVLAYFRYSGSRPLITVNGVAITRKQLQDRVDFTYAKPLLQSMIWNVLINQAAQNANVEPTDQDVANAVAEIDRSDPQVIDNAKRSDPSLTIFKDSLKTDIALRNLRIQGITASPSEIQQYYNTHLSQFKLPLQTTTILVLANNKIDADTAYRLLQNGVSSDIIAQQPGLGVVGVNVSLNQQLPASVSQQVFQMHPGDVKIIPIGNVYGIVKAKSVSPAGTPPLSAIEDKVRIACVLAKSPSEADELKKLRDGAQIVANVGKYADAIPDDSAAQAASAASPSQ